MDGLAQYTPRERPVMFTKPDCVQCAATARAFKKHGIDYDVVDLEGRPELIAQIKQAGISQVPIVITPSGRGWSGFRPGEIKALGARNQPRYASSMGRELAR